MKKGSANVPCGECIACCTSSYFIHIGPGESQTLRRIPKELLFPAPGLPKGHVLLGYDEKGRCPMLVDGKCSIYEHRPHTCRSYDCRVFPAVGDRGRDNDTELIHQRIRRWKFSYPAEGDRKEHFAVQAAATFLHEHADCFPDGFVPSNPAQLAILAIKLLAPAEVDVDVAPLNDPAAEIVGLQHSLSPPSGSPVRLPFARVGLVRGDDQDLLRFDAAAHHMAFGVSPPAHQRCHARHLATR